MGAAKRADGGAPAGHRQFGRRYLTRVLYGYQISLGRRFGLGGLRIGGRRDLACSPDTSAARSINHHAAMDVLMAFPAIVLCVALTGFVGRDTVA